MNKLKLLFGIILGIFLSFFLAGCQGEDVDREESISVATTFYPVEEIAKAVTGDEDVDVMIPTGMDPHSYEPSPSEVVAVSEADVVITMGGMFEHIEDSFLDSAANAEVIEATNNIEKIESSHDHDHSHEDNHSHDEESYLDFDEENNKVIFEKELPLPTPCHSLNDTIYNNNGELVLELNAYDDSQEECIQVIEPSVINKEIDLEEDTHKVTVKYQSDEVAHKSLNHSHDDNHDHSHDHSDDEGHGHSHDHDHGDYDPHVWLSIENMIIMTNYVEEELSELYPENSEKYSENAQNYIDKLESLKEDYNTYLSNCQYDKILIDHKAFGHLGDDYGFEQVSAAGLEPESEPTARNLQEVIDTAQEHDLEYVFVESQLDSSSMETIAGDIGGEVLEVSPVKMSEEEDYFTVMENNLESLQIGLGCN